MTESILCVDEVMRMVRIRDLYPGMVLHKAIRTTTGVLVIAKGHEITFALVERLRNYAEKVEIAEPFCCAMKQPAAAAMSRRCIDSRWAP
jgi:translation initiation factor 2 gamma subunit (eIF-2gamma)